jgi:hypothetical protein
MDRLNITNVVAGGAAVQDPGMLLALQRAASPCRPAPGAKLPV